ncbi:MAG: hypothetical protein MjAS7_0083 [Metallosphaera javensis (ex Sakai et al. 2022)]|nr:MAG: hypothetical protein MjAS7_0083 [Metallosphaera javensis (ex Sakai et al. 2022)]
MSFVRLIPLILIIIIFIYIKFPEFIQTYNSFTTPGFLKVSYLYWVNNGYSMPLFVTLRDLILPQIFPLLNYISLLYLIFLFVPLLSNSIRKNSEIIFYILLYLVFSFLISMPNVPFSKFWESLFFKFPILADFRTQYVEISPFQNILMAYLIGFGSYSLIRIVSNIKNYFIKIIPVILIFIVLIGSPNAYNHNSLVYDYSSVHVPQDFLSVINYLNSHSSQNESILVLPVSETENAENWYHGPSLFPLFLKSQIILGGGYYSPSPTIRSAICTAYLDIYYGNISNNATLYMKNLFYIFNIHYIIVEKDYNDSFYPTLPSGYSNQELLRGVSTYENAGLVKLVYNNTLYSIYETNINSSLAFYSYRNYTIWDLLNSSNITQLIHPLDVEYVSLNHYIISFNNFNKSIMPIFLYFMISSSSNWAMNGGKVINKSNYYGYSLFKIEPYSDKITIYYNQSYTPIIENSMIVILPLILSLILYIFRSSFQKFIKSRKFSKY